MCSFSASVTRADANCPALIELRILPYEDEPGMFFPKHVNWIGGIWLMGLMAFLETV
jgi:hypothetical protein